MNEKFYVTKGIYERLDMRMITYIESLIKAMEVEADYLQVFDLSGDTLIHSQEYPEYSKEYLLSREYGDERLFCIRTDGEDYSYWTLMLAREY